MAFDIFSRNGEILPIQDAQVPMQNIEYAYGFGVYENVRVVRGKALFLEEHIDRLMHSARVIGLEHLLSISDIDRWTKELVVRCASDALNLKMLLIGAREAAKAIFSILPLSPLFPDKKLFTKGASAITARYERLFPNAKTLNMLGSYLAYRSAKEAGTYDALLLNTKGCITEGTRTNFFVVKGMTIIGAPKSEVLEGVTMRHVLTTAKEHGFSVEEGNIKPEDLPAMDGAFLTSTSSKIMPLCKIDSCMMNIPDSLRELMKRFDTVLEQGGRGK